MQYCRFKDGNVIGVTGKTLEIPSATLKDSGFYQCRATSPAGKTMSRKAQLKAVEGTAVVTNRNKISTIISANTLRILYMHDGTAVDECNDNHVVRIGTK